jgi:hypothetical protein
MARVEAGPCSAGTGGECRLLFSVEIDDAQVDPRAHYTVAAHADLDGDGAVSVGDYVSTEAYPVLTRGHPNSANVELHEVE